MAQQAVKVDDSVEAAGLMTIAEVCDFLKVSRSKLYVMLERGDLPSARIDGLRRIPRQAVLDLVRRAMQ